MSTKAHYKRKTQLTCQSTAAETRVPHYCAVNILTNVENFRVSISFLLNLIPNRTEETCFTTLAKQIRRQSEEQH